jgi:hypothetical protein
MRTLILDIATAPLENAADYITTDDITAPSNYKDPAAIARYVDAEKAKRLEKAALDPDTCRVTALGWQSDTGSDIELARDEDDEREVIRAILTFALDRQIVTFNGFKFDLPVLMRRCAYLGVPMPDLNLDRYRSPHVDLYDRLTFRGAITGHLLSWYVKRHGWTDLVKPLTGAEEAQVPQSGRWDELAQSVRHDLTATARLAQWLGVLPKTTAAAAEPIL